MDWHSLYSDCPRMVVGLTVGAGFLLYYFLEAVKKPLVACRRSAWREFLETHLSILQEKYWPTPWCYESRCQTVLASLLRLRLPDITYRREVLQLKDGGQVSLDWLDGVSAGAGSPIVLVLPGLTGSSQSEYVKGLVLAVRDTSARCVVLNNRGIGGVRLMTTRTYCAANSDDLEEALQYLTRSHPGVPLVAVGISLGGMITGNYLTTRGERAAEHLTAAVVVSIPWNMVLGVSSMEKPLCNLLLNRYLAHCLCHLADSMSYQLAGDQHKWNLKDVMKSKTIREFDSRFTAMQFGFRDAEDYYESSCLHDKLDRIKVPVVCLTAADDPFQPLHAIPLEAAERSSHVAIIVTARGGHIGFMEGLLPTTSYYSDRLIRQLLTAIFTNLDHLKNVKKEADDFAFNNVDGKKEFLNIFDGKKGSFNIFDVGKESCNNVDVKNECFNIVDRESGKGESCTEVDSKKASFNELDGREESFTNVDGKKSFNDADGKLESWKEVDGKIESFKNVDGKMESFDRLNEMKESSNCNKGEETTRAHENTTAVLNKLDFIQESSDNTDGTRKESFNILEAKTETKKEANEYADTMKESLTLDGVGEVGGEDLRSGLGRAVDQVS